MIMQQNTHHGSKDLTGEPKFVEVKAGIRLSQKKTHAVDANTLGIKEKWKAIAQILNFL